MYVCNSTSIDLEYHWSLGPFLDVLIGGTSWVVGGCEVALVERSDLIWGECTDDGVQNSAVVEQNEVILAPGLNIVKLNMLFA
jgi:hypothetical protein